jgi:hypothetical protein
VQGLGSGCLGCSARQAEIYTAPPVVTYTDSWRADTERAAVPIEMAPLQEAAPDPARERLVRYASYPITEAEAAPPPVEAEAVAVHAAADMAAE